MKLFIIAVLICVGAAFIIAICIDLYRYVKNYKGERTMQVAHMNFQTILDRLRRRPIDIPKGKNADELREWFDGYEACMATVTKIIEECEEEVL